MKTEWDFEAWWREGEGMPMPELRKKVVRHYVRKYGTIEAAALALRISARTVSRWIKQYNIELN